MRNSEKVVNTHNVAIAPMVIQKFGNWTIMNRLFFHNTFNADIYYRVLGYPESKQWGFSSLLTWKIEIIFRPVYPWGINIANELYAGIVENQGVIPLTGPGFSDEGIQFDRIYAGFSYMFSSPSGSSVTLNPQYIFELNYVGGGDHLRGLYHYFYMVISYYIKFWGDEK
jgi:hypothetical protein